MSQIVSKYENRWNIFVRGAADELWLVVRGRDYITVQREGGTSVKTI